MGCVSSSPDLSSLEYEIVRGQATLVEKTRTTWMDADGQSCPYWKTTVTIPIPEYTEGAGGGGAGDRGKGGDLGPGAFIESSTTVSVTAEGFPNKGFTTVLTIEYEGMYQDAITFWRSAPENVGDTCDVQYRIPKKETLPIRGYGKARLEEDIKKSLHWGHHHAPGVKEQLRQEQLTSFN